MANQLRLVGENEAVRRWERLRIDIPVCLIIGRPDKIQFVNARFRDVCEDGVAVFAGAELVIDSEVQLEFTPSFKLGPLRVRAVVRNRRKYVYGLEFLPRDGKETQTLLELKAMLLPMGTKSWGTADDRRWI